MSTPDALELADALDGSNSEDLLYTPIVEDAAAELRRQHAEIERLRAEVAEWEKLRNPVTLHVSLLRGLPCKLDSATFMHLAGDVEVERLRADAARYQFLRADFSPMGLNADGNHAWAYRRNATLKGPSLDSAIDAAMRDAP